MCHRHIRGSPASVRCLTCDSIAAKTTACRICFRTTLVLLVCTSPSLLPSLHFHHPGTLLKKSVAARRLAAVSSLHDHCLVRGYVCEQASANPEHCLQCACLIVSAPIVHGVQQAPVVLSFKAKDLTVRCLPYLNAMSVARYWRCRTAWLHAPACRGMWTCGVFRTDEAG